MTQTMRPLKPPFDGPGSAADHAKDGFSLYALEQLLRDCDGQPDWRPRADLAHAYYDFKQLSPQKQLEIRRDMGIDPRQTNLIHGVVNGVLGQEARNRSDVTVQADDDELTDVCDVLNKGMKEAQRESNADMAVSNGYAGQVKGGIGWVEVSRASDPLDYPYRVEDRHRNEIYYDWRATDLGLKTARWQVRVRWEDLDEAEALMPEHREILRSCVNGWNLAAIPDDLTSVMRSAYNNERRTTITRDQWLDSTRRRIKFYEVWYRVPAEVVVMQVSPTRRIVFDEQNPLHQLAVQRGRVRLHKAVTRQIRMALFAGPHRLLDVGTTRRNFPYIPFFAFRDDEDRSPYGLIEGMIAPQDEYNERRQMINWMLRARQIQVDSDALDTGYNTIADLVDTAGRPDMVAVMNPKRANVGGGLKIGNDLTLQKEQVDVMQDAKQLIQDVPRVYGTQLGNAPTGVTSGIAINSLTEQGAVAMGELNDNYRFARRMVFEQLLDLIIEDHLEENLKVAVGQGKSRRVIVLNAWDGGRPVNMVRDAPVKVGLGDTPATPAYRLQEQQQLGNIIQALAGDAQALAVLTPAYIEGSTLANRQQYADDLRRIKGVPTPGDRQAQQAAEAQAAQQAQAQQELAMRGAAAKVAKDEAGTELTLAQARKTTVETERMAAEPIASEQPVVTIDQPALDAANEDQLIADSLAEAEQA